MNTKEQPLSPEVTDLFASKINSLVAAGNESLIASVVAEYDELHRDSLHLDATRTADQAA